MSGVQEKSMYPFQWKVALEKTNLYSLTVLLQFGFVGWGIHFGGGEGSDTSLKWSSVISSHSDIHLSERENRIA